VLTTVVLDVGETLVDETPQWQAWAEAIGVPAFTLAGVIGGLAAQGRDHREAFPLLTGRSMDEWRRDRDLPFPEPLLYPDARPALQALVDAGWRLAVGGNQPAAYQERVARLGLPLDVLTSSGSLGVEKPDPAFYRAVAELAGVAPEQCVHVGDRVDNDLVGAREAGMTVVHVRRGPWGVLHGHRAAALGFPQVSSLLELPPLLERLRSG
jgi:HAD superfamily hydrolase (TIGR01509 family)